MSDACTWPEQDAVDAWLEKHGIKVEFKQAMELKELYKRSAKAAIAKEKAK